MVLIPTFNIRNVRLFYLITIFTNGWFVMATWVMYWEKYMSIKEIGIFDAFAFGIALFAQIPSGAVADLIGKRKTLMIGFMLEALGTFAMAFGDMKYILGAGNILFFLGVAFVTGCLDAIVYDSMVEKNIADKYEVVSGKANALSLFSTVISVTLGGILVTIDDRLPWIGWFAYVAMALCISFFFKEPKIDTINFSWQNYKSQLSIGYKYLTSKNLKKYFVVFFITGGIYRLWQEGFLRPLMGEQFGFDSSTLSYIFAFNALITGLFVFNFQRIRKLLKDSTGIALIILLMATGFGLAFLDVPMIIGYFILLMIYMGGQLRLPWVSVILNKEIDSKYRSTTLSTLAFFTQIPYVFLALFAGYIAGEGILQYLFLVIGLILMATLVFHLVVNSQKSKLE